MFSRAPAALLAIHLAIAPCAMAAATSSPFLDDLTTTELADAIRGGKTTILVPIGGTEQNGPHIALGKHNVRVRALAVKIAERLGDALVAPVVAYVPEGTITPPSAHLRFAGTITIPDDAFNRTLEFAARSFRLHGFRDIVLVGDHGGYQKNLRQVAERLNREWAATPVRVHAIAAYYDAAEVTFAKTLASQGYSAAEIGTHAGLADTSLALAIDPSLVRMEQLPAAAAAGRAGGVYGDPRRASAELGGQGIDIIVSRTIDAIHRSIAQR